MTTRQIVMLIGAAIPAIGILFAKTHPVRLLTLIVGGGLLLYAIFIH